MTPRVVTITFDQWCESVALWLRYYGARELADLPIPEATLRIWYGTRRDNGRFFMAQEVADRLAGVKAAQRATLMRYFYDDKRVAKVRARYVEAKTA